MRRYRPAVLCLSGLLLLLPACGRRPLNIDDTREWNLSAEPTLVLGEDGAPGGELNQVVGAHEFSNGDIAVVNGRPAEILLFAPEGSFRRLLGRQGAGPGEFRSILWVAARGDSLVMWDQGLRRGVLLASSGAVAATVVPRPDGAPAGVWAVGMLPDRRWVVITNPARSPRAQPGLHQDTLRLGILSADGSGPLQEVGPALTAGLVIADLGEERLAVAGSRFGVGTLVLVLGDRIVLADGEAGRIRIFDARGMSEREFEAPIRRAALTDDILASLLAEALAARPDTAGWPLVRARHSRPVVPAELPAFRRILGDGDRLVWLEAFPLREGAPDVYHVVRDDGRLMARVETPAGFRVHSVRSSSVLGVHTDADGVERVMRYGLSRR